MAYYAISLTLRWTATSFFVACRFFTFTAVWGAATRLAAAICALLPLAVAW